MREILFRGKRADNGEWVYGYLYIHNGYSGTSALIRGDKILDTEVDIKTIGQYTGLNDKNGNKIFEGDIVKNNWNNIYRENIGSIWEVKFGEYDNSDTEYGSGGNIGFYAHDIRTKEMEGLNNLPCNYNDGIEVIGTIHDGDNND